MPISTRTPEGEPLYCPVCGALAKLEMSDPPGDALCPACGSLLWRLRDSLHRICDRTIEDIALSDRLEEDLHIDSLDVVELVMELEDETGIEIPDADYEKLHTVRDVLEYLRRRRIDPS